MGESLIEMLLLFLLIVPLAQGTSPYVPGTPGAPWTDYELLTVKAKLFRLFRYGISAPAVLRLGFHDCLKYKDGTGGCDGCLNWHGMEHRFGQDGQVWIVHHPPQHQRQQHRLRLRQLRQTQRVRLTWTASAVSAP